MLGVIGFRNAANALTGSIESGYNSYVTGSGSSYSFVGSNADSREPIGDFASVAVAGASGTTNLSAQPYATLGVLANHSAS